MKASIFIPAALFACILFSRCGLKPEPVRPTEPVCSCTLTVGIDTLYKLDSTKTFAENDSECVSIQKANHYDTCRTTWVPVL